MTFDLELLKAILGIISIFAGTAFGVLALLVEYKDKKTGKITRWGRYAILGLAASFLVGALNLWISYTQKSHEAQVAAERSREAAEKTLQIVTDISRSLNPLKDVTVDFWLSYPFDAPELVQYRERLDKGVTALLPDLMKSDEKSVQGVYASIVEPDGKIIQVTIEKDSPLFPSESTENFANTILSYPFLTLYFFKDTVDPKTIGEFSSPDPDIKMGIEGSWDRNEFNLEFDLQTKKISIYGHGISSDPKYWDSSGTIVSALDLPGTQLTIQAMHPRVDNSEPEKRVEAEFNSIVLNIAERRGWWLRKDKLKMYGSPSAGRIYSYLFPKTYQELLSEVEAQ